MIKLLLVDDESVTRKGLMKHVLWKEVGVDIIQDVSNGVEALEISKLYQPDIVIMDIQMPNMDGIKLGTCIREQFPRCKIIYISGYSNKEYLKAAINVSAVSYVDKPINISEMKEAVKKAVSMCMEDRKREMDDKSCNALITENLLHIKQEILTSLLCPKKELTKVMKYLNILNIDFKQNGTYHVIIFKLHMDAEISDDESKQIHSRLLDSLDHSLAGISHISGSKDKNHIAVILSSDAADFQNIAEGSFSTILNAASDYKVAGIKVFCAAGHSASGIDLIYESLFSAEQNMQKALFYDCNYIAFQQDESSNQFLPDENFIPVFMRYIEEDKHEEAISLIENLCMEIKKHDNESVSNIKNMFFKLTQVLLDESEKKNICIFEADDKERKYIREKIDGFQTLCEIKAYLIEKLLSLFENKNVIKSSSITAVEVMRYIQENYADSKLSIKFLADHVFLTPTYLSSLFKKATGKTISEYIVETRINKSKEILLNYHSKLYEVARHVGYTDANYYAKIFKKVTGLNPSEYREKNVSWLNVS